MRHTDNIATHNQIKNTQTTTDTQTNKMKHIHNHKQNGINTQTHTIKQQGGETKQN